MSTDAQRGRVSALALASDPAREALFHYAVRVARPFSRDEAADSVGVPRSTAAFHLDKLAALGALGIEFRRRSEKVGPGAGRPAKFYRALVDEISASIPERHYDLAAEILSATVELSMETGESIAEALSAVATERGRTIGGAAPSLGEALEASGYEPEPEGAEITLTNCPFHHLATSHTSTICSMNHALLRGVVEGVGEDPDRAEFAPAAAHCCVRITPPDRAE
jgi:predicted ArsR family transcriptional regulator